MIQIVIDRGIQIQTQSEESIMVAVYDKTNGRELLLPTAVVKDQPININHVYYMDMVFGVWDKDGNKLGVMSMPAMDNVMIEVHSQALGDQIAWIEVCNQFQKQHKCEVMVACRFPELFEKKYKNLKFYRQYFDGEELPENELRSHKFRYILGYAVKGYESNDGKRIHSPIDCRIVPLQHLACRQLGVPLKEYQPNFKTRSKRIIKDKYVCICLEATATFKLWNNIEGWEQTINYFKSLGYRVIELGGSAGNPIDLAEDWKGKREWKELINLLTYADLFITGSNGLQWLAWACRTPVVTVSNITEEGTEFKHHKVTNTDVCHGCWNDPAHVFDNEDVNYCPRNKDFECTKSITFEMVKQKIDECLTTLKK